MMLLFRVHVSGFSLVVLKIPPASLRVMVLFVTFKLILVSLIPRILDQAHTMRGYRAVTQ
jgi:hypothetical protein